MKQKFSTGDLVVISPTAQTKKLHKHPSEAHSLMMDLENPRLVMCDPDQGKGIESEEKFLVIDHRDLFTRTGKRIRYVKISSLRSEISGWINIDSLNAVALGQLTSEQ